MAGTVCRIAWPSIRVIIITTTYTDHILFFICLSLFTVIVVVVIVVIIIIFLLNCPKNSAGQEVACNEVWCGCQKNKEECLVLLGSN